MIYIEFYLTILHFLDYFFVYVSVHIEDSLRESVLFPFERLSHGPQPW